MLARWIPPGSNGAGSSPDPGHCAMFSECHSQLKQLCKWVKAKVHSHSGWGRDTLSHLGIWKPGYAQAVSATWAVSDVMLLLEIV